MVKINQGIILIAVMFQSTYTATFALCAPDLARQTLNKIFPHAVRIKWNKENAHEPESKFISNNQHYSANYSDTGDWLNTKSFLEFISSLR